MRVANFNQEGGRFFLNRQGRQGKNTNALTTKETKGTKEKLTNSRDSRAMSLPSAFDPFVSFVVKNLLSPVR
jgi:hypothetical protein